LREILQILPLVGLNAFEMPKTVAEPLTQSIISGPQKANAGEPDTIVPAQKGGFETVFRGENAWYPIRISGGMIPKIKFIAA
jgi:hypothetical protein